MRLFKRLTALLVVILAVSLLGAFLLVAPASRAVVESAGPHALGVETSLEDVDLSPGPGQSSLGLQGFKIGNPEGLNGDPFLTVDSLEVELDTASLLSQEISIPGITLDGLHLNLIQDGLRSNYGEILGHIRSLQTGQVSGSSEDPEGAPSPGPTIHVGKVSVGGVAATLNLSGIPGISPIKQTFSLPSFEFDVAAALGPDSGTDEPTGTEVGALTAALVEELTKLGLDQAKKHLDPEIAALLDGNLEGAIRARLEVEAEGILDRAKDELRGELKGLLGGG